VNFAFVVVVVAAALGIASQLALNAIAPGTGPALGLFIMAVGLLATAWTQGKKKAPERAPVEKAASQSLAPV
jgi:hypothetical protein